MAKGTKPPIPTTHWPDSAPSPNEEKIISISVGNTHISWAIHEGVALDLVPTLFWRTPHVEEMKSGTECEMLATYLSDEGRKLIFGSKSADPTKENAIRTCTERRVSLLTIYIVSTNDAQLETLARLLREIPCRVYLMQGDDFFTKEEGRYNGLGIDRLANLLAAGDFKGFPALVFDGGTAMTYTAADKNGKVLGGGIGPGVNVRLRSLSDYASALPNITVDSLHKELSSITDEKGNALKTLPVFARSPKQAIITDLCRDIACNGQAVIQSFLATFEGMEENGPVNGDDILRNKGRLVHVTGGDSDIISRLLKPDCSKLIETEPGKKIPSPPQYGVKKMKHMVHYGIAGALKRKALQFQESPLADMDALLIGQRIAKEFEESDEDGDFTYRGAVSCVHQPKSKYPYSVRFDDGDVEDLSVLELFEALQLYIKVGEKVRDAGESSKEGQGDKITGAKEAAAVLVVKDTLVKKSIEAKTQPKKPAPTPPSLASENESASAKRASGEEESGPRKKAKKSPPTPPPPAKLTKPEKEYNGDRIAKLFAVEGQKGKKELYFGTIGEYWFDTDTQTKLFRIVYDDEDTEDVDVSEFVEMLELYEENKADDPKRK